MTKCMQSLLWNIFVHKQELNWTTKEKGNNLLVPVVIFQDI